MLSKFTRHWSGGLAVLGLAALAAPGLAQSKTYQFLFPAASPIVGFPYTDTTHPASYAPSFTRPNNATTPVPTTLSQSASNVFFDMHTFTVPTSGIYDILSNCTGDGTIRSWWDNFTLLYDSDITTGAAYAQFLTDSRVHCVFANQDFNGSATNRKQQSGFTTYLNAGQTYTLVTTSNNNAGEYAYTDPITSVFTYSNGGPFSNTVTSKPVLGTSVLNVNGTIGPTAPAQSYLAPVPNGSAVPTSTDTAATSYDAQTFSVNSDGIYFIQTTATATNSWRPVLALYDEDPTQSGVSGFNPSSSLTNVLQANSATNPVTGGRENNRAYITATLTKGKVYTLVVSSSYAGYYTNTVTPLIGSHKDDWSGDTISGQGNFMSPAGNAGTTHLTWYYDYDPYYPAGSNPNGSPDPDNYYKMPRILPYYSHEWVADVTGTVTFSTTPDYGGSYSYLYEGAAGAHPFDPGYDITLATTGDEGARQMAGNNALNNLVASTGNFGTGTITYTVTKGRVYNLVTSNLQDNTFGNFTSSIDVTGSGYIGTTVGGPTYNRPWDGSSYTVTLGTQSSGTFSLLLNGVAIATTTYPSGIPYNVTVAALQTALGSSYTIGGTPASATAPGFFTIKNTGTQTITGPLTIDASGLSAPSLVSVAEGPDASAQNAQNPSRDTLNYVWFNSPLATATPYSAKSFHTYTSGSNTLTLKSTDITKKLWIGIYAAPFVPGSAASLIRGDKYANGTSVAPLPSTLLYLGNTSTTTGQVTLSPYFVQGNDYVIVVSGDTNTTAGAFTINFTGGSFTPPIYTVNGSTSYGPGGYVAKVTPNGALPPTSLNFSVTGNGELYYKADNFTITTEGDYNIEDDCTLSDGSANTTWDNFVSLYHDSVNVNNPASFDPTNPLKNILIASDGLTTSSVTITPMHLTPGVYTLVTSEGSASLTYPHTYGYSAVVTPITTPATAVVSYTGALQQIATGPSDGFLTKLPNLPSVTAGVTPGPPTANTSTNSYYFNVPYKAIPFTISTAGIYSVKVTSLAPQALWFNEFLLYKGTFDRTNPITNCLFGAAGVPNAAFTSVVSLVSGATLTAGNYTLVVTGALNSSYGAFPNGSFGPFTAEVNSGYKTYPPVLPDANSAGTVPGALATTITVPDTFNVGTLNSVTITGLSHPRIGDLLATLKHGATTIELFDRVNRTTTGSTDYGSKSIFNGGDYTFAATGLDFGLASGVNLGTVDPTQIYMPFLNGTVGQTSTLTGDFTAFNGQSVAGDWILTLTDTKNGGSYFNGPVAGYSGFKLTVTPIVSTLSGSIALEGVSDLTKIKSAVAPLGTFHVSLRAPGSTTEQYGYDVTLTTTAGSANGAYSIPGVSYGAYDIWIKGVKNLAVLTPNVTVNSAATSITDVVLPAADADSNNTVDVLDFGLLVNFYGTDSAQNNGYSVNADFNFDGLVDVLDFGLLVNEYGVIGPK